MAEILFVDDEQNVLSALRRVFRGFGGHEYHFAGSPAEALEILAARRIAVLVSDHKMPQMTGAEFLSRVKSKRPDTVRIMLTGQADLEAVQKAVNSGEIYRFIMKPWDEEDLRTAVQSAVDLHDLSLDTKRLQEKTQQQNQELTSVKEQLEEQVGVRTQQLADALYTARALNVRLEDTLFVSTKALFGIIQMARPDLGAHSRRVADHAVALGTRLKLEDRELRELEIAALLHDSGKLSVPPYIIDKNPRDYNREELELYRTHPIVGTEVLRGISYFTSVCKFIRGHHERFDGSGFPDRDRGVAVPLQAYIIGISDEFDHLMARPSTSVEFRYQYAYERIAEFADEKFPANLVQALLDHAEEINNRKLADNEMKVGLGDLFPNATLCRDIYTMTGSLLMAKGGTLTAQNISRIRAIARLDPIAGEIYVARKTPRVPVRA